MADQVNLRKEHKNPKGVMNNESKLIRTFATMTTEPQSNFDATAFAEAEESYILSTIGDSDDGDASAPESDEHVETNGPKPLTKAQVNNRKKLAVLVDQVVRHAKRHDIEFLSFFEGILYIGERAVPSRRIELSKRQRGQKARWRQNLQRERE